MGVFIGWLIFSVLAGMFASSRGRSFGGVFVLSLLLSPLVGFIYVLVVKPLPTEAEKRVAADEQARSKKCPFCAETIKAEAVVCRFCGHNIPIDQEQVKADAKFEEWLKTQVPPVVNPGAEERAELRKAFDWQQSNSSK